VDFGEVISTRPQTFVVSLENFPGFDVRVLDAKFEVDFLNDVEILDGKQIKGRVVTTYDKNQKPTTQVESGGKYYAYSGDWKPVSIDGYLISNLSFWDFARPTNN
jgi:hypothetical protein